MTSSGARAFDGLQGGVALIGITVGVIPLIQFLLGADQSAVFRWIFGQPVGSMAYVLPAAVIAVAVGVIAALELAKRRAP